MFCCYDRYSPMSDFKLIKLKLPCLGTGNTFHHPLLCHPPVTCRARHSPYSLITELFLGVTFSSYRRWFHPLCSYMYHSNRGRILGRNWDKSLKSFPPCYSQSPLQTDFTPPYPLEQTGLQCKNYTWKPQV